MSKIILMSGVGLLAIAAAAIGVGYYNFNSKLNRIEAEVTAAPVAIIARADLPAEVSALAQRLGAGAQGLQPVARMNQTGEMWQAPGAKPMAFTARQTNAATRNDFIWRASFAPLGSMQVADSCVDDRGGLEGKLLGLITVVNQSGTADVLRGQMLRYLAELPWNPDAILLNTNLKWTVIDDKQIQVEARHGNIEAAITFTLNDQGFIEGGGTDARPRLEGDKTVERPWQGRFWDYRNIAGRIVPHQGEVAWVIDGKEFIYWRGKITAWEAGS